MSGRPIRPGRWSTPREPSRRPPPRQITRPAAGPLSPRTPLSLGMVLRVGRSRRLDVAPGWLVVLSTASVQVGASVASRLFVGYGPITIVALRLIFGAVLVDLYRRPRLRGTSASAWRSALALGALLAGMNTAFYLAIA